MLPFTVLAVLFLKFAKIYKFLFFHLVQIHLVTVPTTTGCCKDMVTLRDYGGNINLIMVYSECDLITVKVMRIWCLLGSVLFRLLSCLFCSVKLTVSGRKALTLTGTTSCLPLTVSLHLWEVPNQTTKAQRKHFLSDLVKSSSRPDSNQFILSSEKEKRKRSRSLWPSQDCNELKQSFH